jgi:protocatechuate 3,4-dioxygenase beta subunit
MKSVAAYRAPDPGTQPESSASAVHCPRSSVRPRNRRSSIPYTLSEVTGPLFRPEIVAPQASDLTRSTLEPLGERIIVSGRVLDENSRPLANTLVEIWQANAAGRYLHEVDQHKAPLDPNFTGCGQAVTDAEGRYRFVTIRPGEYPWRNHYNAWRPAHIHFSLFGPAFRHAPGDADVLSR